ncbi:MAG: hypothetical protein QM534_00510 [Sediminibacterium sp.]|nr:hypothetical protein [Sediminibacterium sp.]
MKRVCFSFVLVLLFARMFAGEIEDLLKLGKVYNAEDLHLEFRMDINYNTKRTENYSGKYYKTANGYYYSVMHIESYADKQTTVIVDKSQKLMIVGSTINGPGELNAEMQSLFAKLNMDTLKKADQYEVKYVNAISPQKRIAIRFKEDESEFDRIEVGFTSDYLLTDVTYYYRNSVKSQYVTHYKISYQKQSVGKKIVMPVSLSSYITGTKKSLKPVNGFRDYKIIDNRIK